VADICSLSPAWERRILAPNARLLKPDVKCIPLKLLAQTCMNHSIETMKSTFEKLVIDFPNQVFMDIGKNHSTFIFKPNEIQVIELPIGFDFISTRYFKHTPPTYDEIEYAINHVEDEIEKVARSIPSDNHQLVTNTAYIRHITHLCGVAHSNAMPLSRAALEALFGQYAEIAMGRPSRANEADISPRFYAQLLILREVMHHLKFGRVSVITIA
jgi:hypothetical protein